MYKFKTGPEPDHDEWEWVEPEEICEDCGKQNEACECSIVTPYGDGDDIPPDE